jgi:hypothetical protein
VQNGAALFDLVNIRSPLAASPSPSTGEGRGGGETPRWPASGTPAESLQIEAAGDFGRLTFPAAPLLLLDGLPGHRGRSGVEDDS